LKALTAVGRPGQLLPTDAARWRWKRSFRDRNQQLLPSSYTTLASQECHVLNYTQSTLPFDVSLEGLAMNKWPISAAIAATYAVAHASFAQAAPQLPEPSGVFGVGRTSYDWTDTNRPDPFSSDRNARRELMVYVWYPTAADQKTDGGVYVPGAKQIDEAGGTNRFTQAPIWHLIVSGTITSHARERAALPANSRRFPLVLFSHGDGVSGFAYTTAIEDLVSHGYIVAAVEHPYSSAGVVFSDGRVVRFSDRRILTGDRPTGVPYFQGVQIAMQDMRQLNDIQAADLGFVLDRLYLLDRSDRSSLFYGRLDFNRVAAAGHSLGGMTALRACQRDPRIKACANLDGGTADGLFLKYPDAKPLDRPFLYVEATPRLAFSDQQLIERGITRAEWADNARVVAGSQETQLRAGLAGAYDVVLRAPGMAHGSFGDALFPATSPAAQAQALHNLTLTTAVTRAFLDKKLMGAKATLLDRADTAEIQIRKYEPSPK
jgi:pimeloyl-ACP methyl ester carboxylesterase